MPRKRKNPVTLSGEDRNRLQSMIKGGRAPARQLTHARILLKADESEYAPERALPSEAWSDTRIADALQISRSTVFRVRTPVCPGGTGSCPCPSETEKHQAQKTRWRGRGASDRSGLLGASKGEETLECTSSGRSVS